MMQSDLTRRWRRAAYLLCCHGVTLPFVQVIFVLEDVDAAESAVLRRDLQPTPLVAMPPLHNSKSPASVQVCHLKRLMQLEAYPCFKNDCASQSASMCLVH
jgi:hypothetical protein